MTRDEAVDLILRELRITEGAEFRRVMNGLMDAVGEEEVARAFESILAEHDGQETRH